MTSASRTSQYLHKGFGGIFRHVESDLFNVGGVKSRTHPGDGGDVVSRIGFILM